MLAALNSNRWMQREPPPTLLQLLQGRKQVNFRHGMGTLLNKLHRRSVRKWEKKGGVGQLGRSCSELIVLTNNSRICQFFSERIILFL